MKLSVVRRVAEKAGCAADVVKGDEKALRSWLGENVEFSGDDGKSIDWAAEAFEADDAPKTEPKKTTKKSLKASDVTEPEEPADLAAKVNALVAEQVKAQVAATIKSLKFSSGTTVPVIDTGEPVIVRSTEERIYEDRIKAGSAFFKSMNDAIGCHRYLSVLLSGHPQDVRQIVSERRTENQGKWAKWCEHNEKSLGGPTAAKALSTTSVTGGASLVPDIFQPDLIRNVLARGVARKLAKVVPMTAKSMTWPVRTGGPSGSYPGENTTATSTNPTYENLTLNAHTFVITCQASNEIMQDAGIAAMDAFMEEIAYAIATQEDDILLIANSTPTYASMTGFEFKFGTTATDGGYVVVGGADATAHTQAQVVNAIARVPQYARAGMVITCSPTLKAIIFDRLATSTPGGMTLTELEGFGLVSRYMGIPIIENNSMSSVDVASTTNRAGFTAGDQIDFLIGNFQKAALFGDRVGVELAVDNSRGFLEYSTWLRGVVRHDVNVHNRHDTGAASSTKAGPVVSFWQT